MASTGVSKNVSNLSNLQSSNLRFEELLLEAVDVFCMFGDLLKETIYLHLANAFNVKKHDIPHKTDEFVSALEKTFGLGAKIIQIQILKYLHKNVGHEFKYYTKTIDLELTDYLAALRQFSLNNVAYT